MFVGWTKDASGMEFADVRASTDGLTASGVAMGADPVPYRLSYELTTDAERSTTRLAVTSVGEGWRRTVELTRSGGGWYRHAEDAGDMPFPPLDEMPDVADARDVDLQFSPLSHTTPVLRNGLHEGEGTVELVAVGVSVPDLVVRPSRQRYTHLGEAPDGEVVRFDDVDADFTAEIVFDADALVLDCTGVARRILTDAHRHDG